MPDGGSTTTVAISTIDSSRTIVLSGGQWTAGQLFGRSDYTVSPVIGVAQARYTLPSATELLLTRDDNGGNSTWHPFVIEFQP